MPQSIYPKNLILGFPDLSERFGLKKNLLVPLKIINDAGNDTGSQGATLYIWFCSVFFILNSLPHQAAFSLTQYPLLKYYLLMRFP
ncbi:hypothetical protein BVX98_07815 [bacterium F11]|nr:hypothetical protein BVX98_07815 [bacterium F11]